MRVEIDPVASHCDPVTRVPLTIERIVLAAGMAGMALITLANVLTRYLTNISLAFTEEYSILLMVIVTLVGTGYAIASGRHVRIDYFVGLLPWRGQRAADVIAQLMWIAILAVVAWYGARLAWDDYRFGVLSAGLGHDQWIYMASLPVLGLACIGRAIGRIAWVLHARDGVAQ